MSSSSSRRITRSTTARLQAESPTQQPSATTASSAASTATAAPTPARASPAVKKRKASTDTLPEAQSNQRRSKRARGGKATVNEPEPDTTPAIAPPSTATRKRGKKAAAAAMSSAGSGTPSTLIQQEADVDMDRPSEESSAETSPQQIPRDSSRRKSSRRKSKEGGSRAGSTRRPAAHADTPTDQLPTTAATSSKKSRKSARKDQDVIMKDVDEKGANRGQEDVPAQSSARQEETPQQDAGVGAEGGDEPPPSRLQDDELDALDRRLNSDDPFAAGYLSRFAGHSGLSSSLRALTGLVSGTNTRLRNILEQLRVKEDPSVQLIALQELSELLLVSNEDNLAGHFAPDQYVKELVTLMQPNEFTGEENPEMMLLACRCIANLMEALPAATASVVYGGAVPVLCQKLLEIHFIDLAEQALSTLEKISVEFPSSIVREGGLTACLTYLDFFATSTQRTAVTTAANCCRNIPEDSFPVVKDVMPILLTTLSSSDQRVVEQAALCVSRVIDSFKYHESKLEELVSPELLRAILRLLLPGSTNMIGPSIHTQFLRVLSITARASPRLCVELFKMNVVDTLYQIFTGVSAPSETDGAATQIDKNVIMQSIIRTPKEQIFETLNVICELLPTVSQENLMFLDELQDAGNTGPNAVSMSTRSKSTPNDKRLELLKDCPEQVKRFATVLFPTLMHAYTSTVNLNVRQKVLTAQLKMLSNFDTAILEEALHEVTYASHLASILSQQDNPSLVTFALQAAELLLKRLESVYRPQFYREGVIAEISKLAERPIKADTPVAEVTHIKEESTVSAEEAPEPVDVDVIIGDAGANEDEDRDEENDEDNELDEHGEDEDRDDEDDEDDDEDEEAQKSGLPSRSRRLMDPQDVITLRAKRFLEAHGSEGNEEMRVKATKVLEDIKSLAEQVQSCYSTSHGQDGIPLFQRLAKHFDGDALESITSYELMTSGIVEVLLGIFTDANEQTATNARSDFLEVFMSTSNQSKIAIGDAKSPQTAFSVLIHKLQELLSRAENFEVLTVHQNAHESSRGSAASMLAKQLRLKLVANDDSGIPRTYRSIMVSIHAIATFKALDDYLRPRMSLSERPRGGRSREDISSAMAAYAAAMAGRGDRSGLPLPPMPALGSSLPTRTVPSSKPPKTKAAKSGSSATTPPIKTEETDSPLRRSSRKHSAQQPKAVEEPPAATDAALATQPPSADQREEALRAALECADETHLTDEDEMDDELEAHLDALVDDLEEGGLDQNVPDPSAVNLEVATSGKVTARTEDGARVATPSQGAPTPGKHAHLSASARLMAAREMLATPTSSTRAMSYASALQQPPQDWHIEFSVHDQTITSDTTIYRACHLNRVQGDDIPGRNIWSATHTIKFKRVQGPAPTERQTPSISPVGSQSAPSAAFPPSLNKHPVTSGILRLMSILHELNANLDDVLAEHKATVTLNAEPASQFINAKLTAKLNRQLEEPLMVASECLPTWSEDLARLYPFLFPFETRHLFLQSTSFGYSRLMSRWQSAPSENEGRHGRHRDERLFLGRAQRQKVRISRSRILESAIKVMELYGSSSSILEVEYFEEVGTGLGPTLEFYSTVSKEFSKKKTKLWRENESFDNDEFAFGKRGLFPAPMSEEMSQNENGQRVLHLFKMLGKFVARSMLDSRIVDVSFNPTFFRVGDGSATVSPSLGAVATVDQDLAKSLKLLRKFANAKQAIDDNTHMSAAEKVQAVKKIKINDASVEDLGLDFTLPGHPSIELQPQGATIDVTIDNVGAYVKNVIDFTLVTGVQKQVDAFRAGFSQVFPYSALRAFTPDELVMLFGRVNEDWSLETLMDSVKADHGFNLDSKSVRNLLQVMSKLPPPEKRDFLQFVTGSPKLPIGGFKSLTPMFTVVCKPAEPPYASDHYLPSVMTCANYLKMPDYSSLEVLQERLGFAIKEGQGAFLLS